MGALQLVTGLIMSGRYFADRGQARLTFSGLGPECLGTSRKLAFVRRIACVCILMAAEGLCRSKLKTTRATIKTHQYIHAFYPTMGRMTSKSFSVLRFVKDLI